jgi:hypothetical protein
MLIAYLIFLSLHFILYQIGNTLSNWKYLYHRIVPNYIFERFYDRLTT